MTWQFGNTVKIKVGWEEQKANEEAFSHGEDQRLIASLPTRTLQDAVPGRCCNQGENPKAKGSALVLVKVF